jgi:23S rRNA (cytosine1962-C5)-methyltransferase
MAKVILAKGKGRRVEGGHPWVYDNEVGSITGSYEAGDIVEVYNYKNQWIGRGYINPNSHILVRLLTRDAKEVINQDFFYKKIKSAYDYRILQGYQESMRVVFGEADFLPALVIDKFGEYLVIQPLALGIDRYKQEIVAVLIALFSPKCIFERNDVPVRELEGLTQCTGILYQREAIAHHTVTIEENGFQFSIDIQNGQKTGYFLDQTANRASIKPFVNEKRVLDCFSHTGSFAIHAAGYGAKHVTALDISEQAIQTAQANARLNGVEDKIEFVCANAFDALKDWTKENKKFDVVILDPPAFTKSRGNIQNALRGYKEINLRGMKLVSEGGFLITCTCSHFIKPELFREVLMEAAVDANKTIREVSYQVQGKDHPIVWNVEETLYLKFYILQVLSNGQ